MKLTFSLTVLGLVLSCALANAQTITVKGTVTESDNGEPVPFPAIQIKNSEQGGMGDANGAYTIEVPSNGTLIFASIGYETIEVPVNGQTVINVTLKTDFELLDAVVVTGLQKFDRRLFTGASDKIKADESMLSGIADVTRSLEGHAAGVSVQNVSGTFGTAPKIRVRGATSIYGSSKPLWVVDGVIVEDVTDISADMLSSGDAETLISNAVAGLNSDDIESFEILKDGSATSIYGARAMAGVIVVTTKKGKTGTAYVNYTGEFTMRLVPSYNNFNIMNSQDQMGVYQELADKGWLNIPNTINQSDYGIYGRMYNLINTYDPTTGSYGLQNTAEAKNAYLRAAEMRNTDWFKELFAPTLMHTHSVSLSGGTSKSTYYASVSAMVDPGWYKRSGVNRFTANFNLSHKILKNLTINVIGSGSYRKQQAPGTMSQDVDVVNGSVKRDFDVNPYSYALNSSRALDPNDTYQVNYAPFNIKKELDLNYIDLNVVDVKYQAELKYNPIKDLELSALGAVKYTSTSQEHKVMEGSNQAEAYRAMQTLSVRDNNIFLYTDPDVLYSNPVTILPEGGFYRRTDNRMLSYDFRATANYNHTFAQDHLMNIFAGTEINSLERTRSWFNGVGMQYATGEIPFYNYKFFKQASEQNSDYYSLDNTNYRSAAFFANGTYSYKGRYTANATIRYEGTNSLGRSRQARWMPTWNVSGSWNAHEERWFKPAQRVLSHLTLKASYSLTGDRPPMGYVTSSTTLGAYNPWRPTTADKESGIAITSLANDDLTYEKKLEFNIGASVGFINNRINVDFDWYTRKNFDLIGPVVTQGVSGKVIRYANSASMKGSGQELSISSRNIQKKNFKWETNFIFGHNVVEVVDLYSNSRIIDYITGNGFAKTGYPARSLFSIPFMGLNEDGIPQVMNEKGQVSTCDINFQARDEKETAFLKYEGPIDPTFTGSLGNVFSFYGFRINVFITYAFGNVVRLDPVYSATYNDLTAMTRQFKNRWMVPGDEEKTNVPVILSNRQYKNNTQLRYGYNAYNYSTANVASGDFIRMKEISVTYELPKRVIARTAFSNIAFKLQGTNLFLIYSDKRLNGQDPEFMQVGGVASPMAKQFTLTVKFGF